MDRQWLCSLNPVLSWRVAESWWTVSGSAYWSCSFLEIHVGSQWLGLLSYPLLEIHEIHVSSQWLGLLNCSFLEIHKSPQAPQIHRSTEPGSSPDLLDLSYATMQLLTVLIYLLLQAAPDSTRFTQCRISLYTIFLSHTLTLVQY
jgi:hypothetical protein